MNAINTIKRSPAGIELVRVLASEGYNIFTTQKARELAPLAGIKDSYLCESLHHLRRSGWIEPLRRGLYALSEAVPGIWSAHEFEVAMNLVSPAAVSHWSAMSVHGLTEQIPRPVFVLTTTESSVPRVRGTSDKSVSRRGYLAGDTLYLFVQVRPERFFGVERIWINDRSRVSVTDPERTLLDALCFPQYCGTFGEALEAFNVRGDDLDIERIVDYALRLGAAAAKRLGWVLEYYDFDLSRFGKLLDLPVRGYRKLDPTGPRKGPCNSRWMIQENLPGKIAS